MSRAELSTILTDLVRRKAITPEEAAATLARFDAGDLTDLPVSNPQHDASRWVLALALLLFMMKGNTRRTLNANERKRAQRLLRTQYEAKMATIAGVVASGGPISVWHTSMQVAIADYARMMAVAGAGTLPKAKVQAAVDAQLDEQWPYLEGFATQIAAKRNGDNPMSEAAIASRSKLYGSVAYGAFWRGAEPDAGFGQVIYYRAVDDKGTCSPCSEAERNSPYIVGDPYPRPGEICEGRGNCRCTLEFVNDPEIYAQLAGQRAA